jgi:endonuclease/exonuclease/phosphatase family metal-dependent hydrolase
MLRYVRRLAITSACVLLVLGGLQVAADAGTTGHHRVKRGLARPVLSGHGVAGGAQFTWGTIRGAKRFRVAWSAAPFGKWPAKRTYVSRWLPKNARSSTFAVAGVPQSGDHMLGVAYANPVFGQLDARNAKGRVRHSTGWVPVFPAAPDPGTGDAMRLGTYNVMMATDHAADRVQAVAANIAGHGLDVVVLQEATDAGAQAIARALGSGWAAVPYSNSPEQILYRTSVFQVPQPGSYGTFSVYDAKTPSTPLTTPWVRLQRANASASSHAVFVVSAHVTEDASKGIMDRKRDAGIEAQNMMAGVNAVNPGGEPVVIAGDLHYLREPWSDVPGYVEAPPTLVRGGYYDAMAALSKNNIAYPTFNGGNGRTAPAQSALQSGVAARADYIMLKGFRGSNAYTNVANWSWNGLTPSDHNLVYADLTVPFR